MLTSDPEVASDPTAGGETPPSDPAPQRHRIARVVGSVGRLMITSGTVIAGGDS